jgi:hypothetical protein
MRYYVRSTDGQDYAVTLWVDGQKVWRTRDDAIEECRALSEPGAYVWGTS